MRILLIGCGRIGSRYRAILNYLKIPVDIYDPKYNFEPDVTIADKWIIASPTNSHSTWIQRAIELRKPFLVEKPVSKNLAECKILADMVNQSNSIGSLVCNYKYILNTSMAYRVRGQAALSYDYYNPGDELEWSCSQILLLDPQAILKSESPIWKFKINRSYVDYQILEKSYIRMIKDFVNGEYHNLWNMEDGIRMTEIVLKRLG
jgi:hypothetical protein